MEENNEEEDDSVLGEVDWKMRYHDLRSTVDAKWNEMKAMQKDGETVDASKLVLMMEEIHSVAFKKLEVEIEATNEEDYVSLGCTPTQRNPQEDLEVEVQVSSKNQTNVDASSEAVLSSPPKEQKNAKSTSGGELPTTAALLKFHNLEVPLSQVREWAKSNLDHKVKEIEEKNSRQNTPVSLNSCI